MTMPPLWSPSESAASASQLMSFARLLNKSHDLGLKTFLDIHAFSIADPDAFWAAAWDFLSVIGDRGSGPAFRAGQRFETARFFDGASLNYAENCLRRRDDTTALVFRGENKVHRSLSWAELHAEVSRAQQMLQSLGVGPSDRVAAVMPNIPEAVIGLLAAASLGAIWSSASPDFGVQGVLDRFGQIEPKVLIVCDGYYYNGKTIGLAQKAGEIAASLPSLAATLCVSYIGRASEVLASAPGAQSWTETISAYTPAEVTFDRLPFEQPLFILYSSGTTGTPKCIVHSAGGILLQHMKEHRLHCDLRPGERLFYFTTCGWMMWNWLASALASEVTLVLYDGSPFYPDGNVLFDYADETGIAVFGTSAKYIDSVKKAGLRPRDTHDLKSIRMVTSTGSPLSPESFEFVYDAIKVDVALASISGGTDICSCFVLGNPLVPVYPGEIQGPGLGMAVDVFDEHGQPQKSGKGELVCTKPFPAVPIGFWNDPNGRKFHGTYFERFPGVWHHGDFAEWTEHGGVIIHGRSDATLNPGGVRIGTAEIYRQVEQLAEVKEAIVIGQDWDGDVRVVLFVVLANHAVLDEPLRDKIKSQIRNGATPRHVPALILAVPDIPRTKSGKITEIAVREIVHGRGVTNEEALANPEALHYYADLPELQV